MKLQRHVSAVMAALVLTGLSYSAGATDINVSSDKAEELRLIGQKVCVKTLITLDIY